MGAKLCTIRQTNCVAACMNRTTGRSRAGNKYTILDGTFMQGSENPGFSKKPNPAGFFWFTVNFLDEQLHDVR